MDAPRFSDGYGWCIVKVMHGGTSTSRILIEFKPETSLYRYSEETYYPPADEDEGVYPNGFWQIVAVSGLFSSAEDAERDAWRRRSSG